MAGKFQLSTKSLFLTYPKVPADWTKNLVRDTVYKIASDAGNQPYGYLVARELHEDGTPHFHVLLQFVVPFRTRNERIFDIQAGVDTWHHPNIQSTRDPAACAAYLQKDGMDWSGIFCLGDDEWDGDDMSDILTYFSYE